MLARCLRDDARFGNGAGERFLAINVSPALQSRHRRHRVRMVRRPDNHRVNSLLVEQPAKVIIRFRLRIFLLRRRKIVVVNVAERDNVFAADFLEVVSRAVGDADHGNIQPFIRRNFPGLYWATRQPRARGGHSGLFDELSAVE